MLASAPRAALVGCASTRLSSDEKALFRDLQPSGFILFQRNCASKAQVQHLVQELLDCVAHRPVPILIDQEGGTVMRLKPPIWPERPAASVFADIWQKDRSSALRACYLNNALIAMDLSALNITVNCTPVLDMPVAGADPVIGSRAYGVSPDSIIGLGQAVIDAHLDHGVLPIIKHIPGHGRATVDSHKALPTVTASHEELRATDFAPFKALQSAPWAMTAHIVYSAIDARCATISPIVIEPIIRQEIGFDGVLISDDIGMKALTGSVTEKTHASLNAGCDLVLHCSGDLTEMKELLTCPPCTPAAQRRLQRGWALRQSRGDAALYHAYSLELESLLSSHQRTC